MNRDAARFPLRLFGALTLAAFALQGCRETEAERDARNCTNTVHAYSAAQDIMRQNLRAPSTAEFPWITASGVSVVRVSECNFMVTGYVDAQNGFGAMIRTRYAMRLNYNRATNVYRASDLTTD